MLTKADKSKYDYFQNMKIVLPAKKMEVVGSNRSKKLLYVWLWEHSENWILVSFVYNSMGCCQYCWMVWLFIVECKHFDIRTRRLFFIISHWISIGCLVDWLGILQQIEWVQSSNILRRNGFQWAKKCVAACNWGNSASTSASFRKENMMPTNFQYMCNILFV